MDLLQITDLSYASDAINVNDKRRVRIIQMSSRLSQEVSVLVCEFPYKFLFRVNIRFSYLIQCRYSTQNGEIPDFIIGSSIGIAVGTTCSGVSGIVTAIICWASFPFARNKFPLMMSKKSALVC